MNPSIHSAAFGRLKRAAALALLCGLLAACDSGGSSGAGATSPDRPVDPETPTTPETPKQLKCAP
ncbi:hypothetical protein [Alcaligenes sp. SDU_A2]|uniref:hypothetical protein n=1 Tax=Alcaligenes sp. SDU_A2 TaxID=3136634 RepID=UPI00311EF220